MSALFDRIHFILGRSKITEILILKLRNQCNSALKYSLCTEANPHLNGEYLVLNELAEQIKSFADVGANRGDYANKVIDKCKITIGHIFEPSRKCFEILQNRFFKKNNLKLYNLAVSDVEGTAQFYFDNDGGETSSIVAIGKNSYTVPVETLDNVLTEELDFLKIDTEGYDLHVLKGASKLMAKGKIRFIQFEYGPYWKYAGSTLYSAIQYLNDFGFILYRIDKRGLFKHDYELYGEYFTYSNFFACKTADLKYISKLIID